MVENSLGDLWQAAAMAPELTAQEKILRDKFAAEYVIDFDGEKACQRLGFFQSFAKEYAVRFLSEPYTQAKISELKTSEPDDPVESDRQDRRLVRAALRQALQNGSYTTRVQAAGHLSSILGMNAPVKTQQDVYHRGGVMLAPAISDVSEWEKEAERLQTKLMQEART